MRLKFFYIIILITILDVSLFAQKEDAFSRKKFKGNITNNDVVDAKRWHHSGLTEKSLKKGLEILGSNKSLTQVDSFHTYQILAYNYSILNAHESALEHAKKAVDINNRINHSQESHESSWIAPYYTAAGDFNSAIYYLKAKAKHQLNNPSSDNYDLAKTHNNIGFTYYLANQYDSAEVYYKKVTAIETINKDYDDIIGLATGNLGQLYFDKKDYKNALFHLKIDAKLTKGRIIESYYNATVGIAECYLMLGDLKNAKKTLLTFFKLECINKKVLLRGYKLMASVSDKLNKQSESALYLRKYIYLNDSLTKNEKPTKDLINQLSKNRVNIIEKDLRLSESKIKLMNNKLLLAKTKEKSERFKNRVYIILLILSIFSAILIIIYFRNRQKKNKEIQALESELFESEIQSKKKELNNLITNLSYKRKFINEIQEKLKDLKQKPEGSIKESIALLIREFTNYKNADKGVEVLQTDIDQVNLSFFKKLGEKHPLLTENEKELCGLFLLKLSSKDIAIIRNVTPNAIKKARQRIRKKLPISEKEKITTFLENI